MSRRAVEELTVLFNTLMLFDATVRENMTLERVELMLFSNESSCLSEVSRSS